jgi:hypothetical protein
MSQNTNKRNTQYADLAHNIWWNHIAEDRQIGDILDRHFDQDQFAKFSKKIERIIARCIYDSLHEGEK